MTLESHEVPRRRTLPALLFAAGLAVVVLASVLVLSLAAPLTRQHDPQTDNAYVGGDVTTVAARVQGYLLALPVADNQPVHAGDVIARIDPAEYRAALDQAEADLRLALARQQAIQMQQQQLVAQIGQTESTAAGVATSTQRTAPELARQRILVHTDAGVRRALDQAEADQRSADARIAAAQAQVQVRQRQSDILAAQAQEAAAIVAARQADVALAQLNLEWTQVVAPIDGRLGARLVRPGDLMRPGTAIISVTPLDGVWVDANFTERQIPFIRIGDRVTLQLDTFPGEPLTGRVAGLSPVTGGRLSAVAPDNTTGNFTKVPARVPVRIAILWGDSRLRGLVQPGLSALATVQTGAQTVGDARCATC